MAKKKPISHSRETKNMYSSPNFDTHKFVKSFVESGTKESEAEAIVSVLVESKQYDFSNLASKEQLESTKEYLEARIESTKTQLENKIEDLREDCNRQFDAIKEEMKHMVTKEYLEIKLDNKISQLEASLLKWFVATAIAMTGIIVAAIKFLH